MLETIGSIFLAFIDILASLVLPFFPSNKKKPVKIFTIVISGIVFVAVMITIVRNTSF